MKTTSKRTFQLGERPLTIKDVVAISLGDISIELSSTEFRQRIEKGYEVFRDLLETGQNIYGVTTGYGDSCTNQIQSTEFDQLPINLVRYHGCGLGDFFNIQEARAIQISRIASLAQGVSGIRFELIEFLVKLLNLGIQPIIPKEGSVGASGDLTPLSYLAANCLGEGEVYYMDRSWEAGPLFQELNIQPPGLKPKEGLALMNGTAVMTALACLAHQRSSNLAQWAAKITAANTLALLGNPSHFEPFLFKSKPHRGSIQAAEWIYSDFTTEFKAQNKGRLQDRYSIRCAPHIIGVLQDALDSFQSLLETELNSANDNPLIDVENRRIFHGGNFYGGHIAFIMDSLKVLIANVGDLLDRQLALLVDPKFNNGLPANLTGSPSGLHHGLKAVQISTSAWTAEALKNSTPASIFSRSTECHNQDKVSMGTIAARDCIRVLELVEQISAATAVAAAQALHLRLHKNTISEQLLGAPLSLFIEKVQTLVPVIYEDRRLDKELRALTEVIKNSAWEIYK